MAGSGPAICVSGPGRCPAATGDTLETTLAHATRTVRYDVRRVLAADYHWTFSREPRDFERFYDEFYQPFVGIRFGPLAVLRERQVLRRHFRQKGGLIWLWRDDQIVGGDLVRENGHQLHALIRAVHPTYSALSSRAPVRAQCGAL